VKKINVTIYSIDIDPSEGNFNKNRVYYYKYIYWSSDRIIYFHWKEKKTSYFLVLDNKCIINDSTFIFDLCEGRKKSFSSLEKVGEFTLLIPGLKLLNGLYGEHLGNFVTCSGLGMGSFGLSLFDMEEENGVNMLLEKLALYIITECT
jgi:hypothetical protein